jgi:hypothetical protein
MKVRAVTYLDNRRVYKHFQMFKLKCKCGLLAIFKNGTTFKQTAVRLDKNYYRIQK